MKVEIYSCYGCGDKIEEEKKNSKCSCGSLPPHDHMVHYYCDKCSREIEKPLGDDPEICPNCAILTPVHPASPPAF